MIIITQQSGGTNTAQIRSPKESGFKVLYRASSTESEASAARAVVSKFFGDVAASTIKQVPDSQIADHVLIATNRRRCSPVSVWTFNPKSR